MDKQFDFNDLFVLDLANNHQGSVEHGKKIIRAMAKAVRRPGARAGIKFQFRQLDTFIHVTHRSDSDNKHIPRFLSTRLLHKQFQDLLDEVRAQELLAICTPFDEESVDIISEMGFDIVKIASCSAKDWPLVQKVAESGLPVICSTGGLKLTDIDNLASFFEHRAVDYAFMHCVSIYPTPDENMQLNQIDQMRSRYPGRVVGWSTHEPPDDLTPVAIAVAKGARMFERHVGLVADGITLNAYSSTAEQVDAWIAAYLKARAQCGDDERPSSPEVERESIASLRRGTYAKTAIEKGALIDGSQVYFAMPYVEDQLESGAWRDGIAAKTNIAPDEAILRTKVVVPTDPDAVVLKHAIHDVKAMLNKAKIALDVSFQVEFSHHFGIGEFRRTGCVLITCINREYCKKLLVQLPGQGHPLHFHKRKEETFQVLSGEMYIEVDGRTRLLTPGESALVLPGVWHRFWTDTGAVIEEVSTTHYHNDSVYRDKAIQDLPREARKTVVDHWGRYQMQEAE